MGNAANLGLRVEINFILKRDEECNNRIEMSDYKRAELIYLITPLCVRSSSL